MEKEMVEVERLRVPSYEHECDPPAVDILRPERRRWYCPDCGTGWLFGRREMDGRMVGKWFPAISESGAVTIGLPVAKLRQLAETLDEDATEFYYANRHTHPQGIGYACGYEAGMSDAANRLRKEVG
jgi:hypothetical protein